jgi:hypothetical protein
MAHGARHTTHGGEKLTCKTARPARLARQNDLNDTMIILKANPSELNYCTDVTEYHSILQIHLTIHDQFRNY